MGNGYERDQLYILDVFYVDIFWYTVFIHVKNRMWTWQETVHFLPHCKVSKKNNSTALSPLPIQEPLLRHITINPNCTTTTTAHTDVLTKQKILILIVQKKNQLSPSYITLLKGWWQLYTKHTCSFPIFRRLLINVKYSWNIQLDGMQVRTNQSPEFVLAWSTRLCQL